MRSMSQCSECLEQRELSSPRANSKERESSHKDFNTFAMCVGRVLSEKKTLKKPNAGIEPATLGYTQAGKSLATVNIFSPKISFRIFTPRSTN